MSRHSQQTQLTSQAANRTSSSASDSYINMAVHHMAVQSVPAGLTPVPVLCEAGGNGSVPVLISVRSKQTMFLVSCLFVVAVSVCRAFLSFFLPFHLHSALILLQSDFLFNPDLISHALLLFFFVFFTKHSSFSHFCHPLQYFFAFSVLLSSLSPFL